MRWSRTGQIRFSHEVGINKEGTFSGTGMSGFGRWTHWNYLVEGRQNDPGDKRPILVSFFSFLLSLFSSSLLPFPSFLFLSFFGRLLPFFPSPPPPFTPLLVDTPWKPGTNETMIVKHVSLFHSWFLMMAGFEGVRRKERKLTSSTLVIQSSDRVDGGLYKCNATNKWGQDMSFIQLIIEGKLFLPSFLPFSLFPSPLVSTFLPFPTWYLKTFNYPQTNLRTNTETPEKPIHLQIQNVTGTSANISWIEQFNGNSNIIKYIIKLNDPVSNETLSETFCLGPNATIENLKPNTAFLATVFAINEVGWSEASEPILFRTAEAAPSGPPLNVLATATGPNSVKLSWKVIRIMIMKQSNNLFHFASRVHQRMRGTVK